MDYRNKQGNSSTFQKERDPGAVFIRPTKKKKKKKSEICTSSGGFKHSLRTHMIAERLGYCLGKHKGLAGSLKGTGTEWDRLGPLESQILRALP